MPKNCKNCNKIIHSKNRTMFCLTCYRKTNNELKINKWKLTGDTGCNVATTLRNVIRKYILEKQKKCCAICNSTNEWQGKELKFVLDHIDGNASNNNENNLRLVCPNCDSQLDTFKSKNKKSARNHRNIVNELI